MGAKIWEDEKMNYISVEYTYTQVVFMYIHSSPYVYIYINQVEKIMNINSKVYLDLQMK